MTLTKTARLRARKGFSLMEMLVVVILVGIIMSVAGVRVSAMITQQRVIRAASTIQTQMETAFALAGRQREPMKIVFATSSGAITVKTTNRDGTTVFTTTDLRQLGLSNGNVTASVNEVTIFPNGFANDTLSIKVLVVRNGATYQRIVRMSRAGLIKVI